MNNQKGFTLIELMVTLTVLGIVLAWAIPSFNTILSNNRLETAAHELHGALQLARSEAVKRREGVRLCALVDGDMDECATDADWSEGWLMVAGDEVLRVWQMTGDLDIDGPADGITFGSSGMSGAAADFAVAGAACVGDQKRELKVSPVGQVTLRRGEC